MNDATYFPLEMFRGNSDEFTFRRKDAQGQVILTPASEVIFTVASDYDGRELIRKTLTDGDITFDGGIYTVTIDPEDTQDLIPARYVYDILVIVGAYEHTVANGEFIVKPTVSRRATGE